MAAAGVRLYLHLHAAGQPAARNSGALGTSAGLSIAPLHSTVGPLGRGVPPEGGGARPFGRVAVTKTPGPNGQEAKPNQRFCVF